MHREEHEHPPPIQHLIVEWAYVHILDFSSVVTIDLAIFILVINAFIVVWKFFALF